jgi:hypothetical protein
MRAAGWSTLPAAAARAAQKATCFGACGGLGVLIFVVSRPQDIGELPEATHKYPFDRSAFK